MGSATRCAGPLSVAFPAPVLELVNLAPHPSPPGRSISASTARPFHVKTALQGEFTG
jgi:hypothetical protein